MSSLPAVGSRIELERYIDSLRYAQGLSNERLIQASAYAESQARSMELGNLQTRLQDAKPAMEASQLLLQSASTTASDMKTKIEDALIVYDRAVNARVVVEQVSTLRSSLQGIHSAMEMRDWERAAQLASTALSVPEEVAKSQFAMKMVPSSELPDEPVQTLTKACDEMEQIFLREFSKAASALLKQPSKDNSRSKSDSANAGSAAANGVKEGTPNGGGNQLTRYFKMFPLIGRRETGLRIYSQFICQIIAQLARNLLVSAAKATKENPTFYAAALSRLYENVAVLIEQHSRLIQKHYGSEVMVQVLPQVQLEIDKQSLLIVDTFWDERRVEQLLTRCRQYSYPELISTFLGSKNAEDEETPNSFANEDLREAGSVLNELSTMLNRFHLYKVFVFKRFDVDLESQVQEKIDELLAPTFSTLSLYVFRRSVEVAVQLDELPTQEKVNQSAVYSLETPLASSLVDDVVYVFNSILQQTLSTGNPRTIDISLAGIKRILEADLVGTLQRKLRNVAPVASTISAEFGGAGPFMLYLNDLELLVYYVGESVNKLPPLKNNNEENEQQASVRRSVESLSASFKFKCDELINDGCQTLVSARMVSQSRQAVAAFKSGGREFEKQWNSALRPLKQLLHPRILYRVLQLMCRHTAAELEQYIWSLDGRVTAAALLELESDISIAISCCVETQYALRQYFTKLAQIVNALVEDDTSGLDPEDASRVAMFRIQ